MIENIELKNLIRIEKYIVIINILLAIITFYYLTSLGIQFSAGRSAFPQRLDIKSNKIKQPQLLPAELAELPAFGEFQKLFAGKKLFSTSTLPANDVVSVAGTVPNLVLAGIVIVDNQPLALIRDVASNLDFYCRGGENILGYYVKEVLPKKVILEFDGQELELQI